MVAVVKITFKFCFATPNPGPFQLAVKGHLHSALPRHKHEFNLDTLGSKSFRDDAGSNAVMGRFFGMIGRPFAIGQAHHIAGLSKAVSE